MILPHRYQKEGEINLSSGPHQLVSKKRGINSTTAKDICNPCAGTGLLHVIIYVLFFTCLMFALPVPVCTHQEYLTPCHWDFPPLLQWHSFHYTFPTLYPSSDDFAFIFTSTGSGKIAKNVTVNMLWSQRHQDGDSMEVESRTQDLSVWWF